MHRKLNPPPLPATPPHTLQLPLPNTFTKYHSNLLTNCQDMGRHIRSIHTTLYFPLTQHYPNSTDCNSATVGAADQKQNGAYSTGIGLPTDQLNNQHSLAPPQAQIVRSREHIESLNHTHFLPHPITHYSYPFQTLSNNITQIYSLIIKIWADSSGVSKLHFINSC